MTAHDGCLLAVIRFKETLSIATLAIRTPIGLLWVVWLEHVRPLHVHGDDEVGRWIGIRLPGLSKLDMARHDEVLSVAGF